MSGLSSLYHSSLSSDLSSEFHATMTTTPLDDRPRLKLNPMWTPHFDFDTLPGFSLGPTLTRGHIYFPSPRSPKVLPAPVLPSVSQDGMMRQHERSLVERLDQRMCQSRAIIEVSPVGSRTSFGPLSPVYTDPGAQKTLSSLAIPNPRTFLQHPPTPASTATTSSRRHTIALEARSMLPASLGDDTGRRQSVPVNRSKIYMRQLSQQEQLRLRAWGQIYLGDSTSADVFVHAVSLRRPSDMSEATNSAASSPLLSTKHIVLRARVRRRNNERKNFFIRREFVIDDLRASIPDPLHIRYLLLSPASVGRAPAQQVQRSPLLTQPLRRRSSCAQNACPSPSQGLRSESGFDDHAMMYGSRTMPIHIEYARLSVPLLAALIASGHVRKGDLIELPLPHPEAWPATVAYIYTGRDEPTTTVKENITYLTGKVPLA